MTLIQSPRCECRIEEGLCPEEAEVQCCVCSDLLCRAHAQIVWSRGEYVCICGDVPNACGYAIDKSREYRQEVAL